MSVAPCSNCSPHASNAFGKVDLRFIPTPRAWASRVAVAAWAVVLLERSPAAGIGHPSCADVGWNRWSRAVGDLAGSDVPTRVVPVLGNFNGRCGAVGQLCWVARTDVCNFFLWISAGQQALAVLGVVGRSHSRAAVFVCCFRQEDA